MFGGLLFFRRHAFVQGGGRVSARRPTHFSLLRQRKVSKRKATHSLRPLRCAARQTSGGALAGCAVELATRCALRSNNHGESDNEACVLRHTLTPQPPRRRRSQMGVSRRTATRAIAALGPQHAGAVRRDRQAERSNGPNGCLLPTPFGCAWGAQGARRHVCRRTHMLRDLTRRGCLNVAPQARSEFHGAPRDRAPQVAPQRSEGVADSRVAFSLVTFFWRSKRKLLACRATPGLRPYQSNPPNPARKPRLRQAQPERVEAALWLRPFDKLRTGQAQPERAGVALRLRQAQPERFGTRTSAPK